MGTSRVGTWWLQVGGLFGVALGLVACGDSAKPAPAGAASASSAPALTAPAVATSAPAPTPAAAREFACGAKDQEPCPMQKWMKAEVGRASAEEDLPKLAAGLAVIAARDPGFPEWKAIADQGRASAAAGDLVGARRSCRDCHDLYKRIYVTTMRDRPF